MKEKMHVIYSNDLYEKDKNGNSMIDYARDFLFETKDDSEGWNNPQDIPDELVFKQACLEDEMNLEDFEWEFKECLKHSNFILVGTIGRWDGRYEGGTIVSDINDLRKFFHNCDYINIYDKGGHLFVEATHHDGTNFAELKRITRKGEEYINAHQCDSPREIHRTVMESNFYSALPHYAHKVFGLRKYE